MSGGFSSCHGILLYETSKEGDNAIYGYYNGDECVVIEGTYKELKVLREHYAAPHKRKDKTKDRIFNVLLLIVMVLLVIVFINFSFLTFIACLSFCVISFIPFLTICYAFINLYNSSESDHQFRKYHGTEHAMLNLLYKKKDLTMENIKKVSFYDSECGTVYSGNFIIIGIIVMILIMNIYSLGIIKAIGILLGCVIILFINLWNPLNPLLFLQSHTVEQPTDKEYYLAIKMLEKAKELGIFI